MSQEQVNRSTGKQEETTEVVAKDERNQDLSADVEDLLADIDEVLEENAAEFVGQFIQKGGQ